MIRIKSVATKESNDNIAVHIFPSSCQILLIFFSYICKVFRQYVLHYFALPFFLALSLGFISTSRCENKT